MSATIVTFFRLLHLGLQLFGDDNLHSIRSYLLPAMSVKQLLTRYKNMRSRRGAADNPLKDYYLMRVKPFTLEEEELMRKFIKLNGGKKFKSLSDMVLKDRPPFLLKQFWRRLYPRSFKTLPKRAAFAGTIAGMTTWISSGVKL